MSATGERPWARDWRVWVAGVAWLVVLAKLGATWGGWGAEWWQHDGRTLWRDQSLFYARIYPHAAVAAAAGEVRSAYPPTSFPLLAPWFPPGLPWSSARGWLAGAQLAALALWVGFAWRRGRAVDARLGWLLAGALLAMSGVRADLLFGNLALIGTALMLAALLALESGRAGGAAAAWLAAMAKPQIGWLFALAWWRRDRWRAWLGAAFALGASGVAACAWTGVSLAQALGAGTGEETGKWAAWSPLNNLVVQLGAWGLPAAAALALGAALGGGVAWWALRRPGLQGDGLGQFAVLGLINRVCTYHNYCDDVLLVFALVWLGRRAARGDWRDAAAWLLLALSTWLPTAALTMFGLKGAVLIAWSGLAVWIACRAEANQRAGS